MSVEVALQEALDLLGPGLQTGHPAGLPVVDDRSPLVLTQRGEQVGQVGELGPALEVVGQLPEGRFIQRVTNEISPHRRREVTFEDESHITTGLFKPTCRVTQLLMDCVGLTWILCVIQFC